MRDDGMSYGDYVEQLTYLLFLKMDQEGSTMLGVPSSIPEQFNWASLQRLDGEDLESHYRATLTGLDQGAGLIPAIFRKSQNKIQAPAKLRRLIELIDGETWVDIDVKQVSEGEILNYGDLVGLSGNTGNSTGAHLHYGIKQKTGENSFVWLNPQSSFTEDEYISIGCSD